MARKNNEKIDKDAYSEVESILKFKKEFLLANFKNTQDIRTQSVEFLNRIRTWFLTVWLAAISFLSTTNASVFNTYIILFAIILLFWSVNIGWGYRKEDVSRIIKQFEKYLMTITDQDILQMKGPLMSIYQPPTTTEKRATLKKVIFSWINNDIFIYTAIISSFLPLLIAKSK